MKNVTTITKKEANFYEKLIAYESCFMFDKSVF